MFESSPSLGVDPDVEGLHGALVRWLGLASTFVSVGPVARRFCSSLAQAALDAIAICYGMAPEHRASNVASTSHQPNVPKLEFKLEAALKENAQLHGEDNELLLELERHQSM